MTTQRFLSIPFTLRQQFGLPLMIVAALLCFTSCVDEEEYADTVEGNFEALWHIIDEHYCFFAEKQVDWDAVHATYSKAAKGKLTRSQLFEVCSDMLSELRDGHVNLYSTFDVGRYWAWHEDYPANYSDTLVDRYLGKDYKIAASLRYKTLDDNIGYVRYASFSSTFGESNLDAVLFDLAPCRALIIDIRSNGGGLITSAEKFAARFTNEERLVGYIQHKTGKGRNDFSEMQEQRLKPSSDVRWQKKVAVLTNRGVFSAANEFVKYMKCFPNVIIVRDRTGGGAGVPFSSQLPNGWSIRFSACPMYDRDKQCTEFGIAPDYAVGLTDADFARGIDTVIETARRLLVSK